MTSERHQLGSIKQLDRMWMTNQAELPGAELRVPVTTTSHPGGDGRTTSPNVTRVGG